MRFIELCWIAWAVYWLAMAFGTKRTIERGGFIGYRIVTVLIAAGIIGAVRLLHGSPRSHVWHTTAALSVVAGCIVVAGFAFTVWARITLGRNWSAEVTFKQDHELIESGPYALARHPIYTGLILMALGTTVDFGRTLALALLAGICGGLWWKARQEERIMQAHFPDTYPESRARVRAIIPFVL